MTDGDHQPVFCINQKHLYRDNSSAKRGNHIASIRSIFTNTIHLPDGLPALKSKLLAREEKSTAEVKSTHLLKTTKVKVKDVPKMRVCYTSPSLAAKVLSAP